MTQASIFPIFLLPLYCWHSGLGELKVLSALRIHLLPAGRNRPKIGTHLDPALSSTLARDNGE